jgi:hypothetical protein
VRHVPQESPGHATEVPHHHPAVTFDGSDVDAPRRAPLPCCAMGELNERIGAAMTVLRQKLTQDELAEVMQGAGHAWGAATVAAVESGDRPLTLAEATDVARVVGCDLFDLLRPAGTLAYEAPLLESCRAVHRGYREVVREVDSLRKWHARLRSEVEAVKSEPPGLSHAMALEVELASSLTAEAAVLHEAGPG